MQVTLQEPLIFEGLERARFWSSHGTLQREIAPHNPCAVFSLFSLVCLQVMSASRNFRIFRKTCVETNLVEKKCAWLAMSRFPLHVLRLMEGWHKAGFRSGDLRMEGDIRFIAASSFLQPCVEVKGSASMFGNIHFEGCHNKDQDRRPALGVETHPKIGGEVSEHYSFTADKFLSASFFRGATISTTNRESFEQLFRNKIEHLRIFKSLVLSPRFGFKGDAINYTSSTAQGGGGSFKNRKPIGRGWLL